MKLMRLAQQTVLIVLKYRLWVVAQAFYTVLTYTETSLVRYTRTVILMLQVLLTTIYYNTKRHILDVSNTYLGYSMLHTYT